MKEAEVRNRDWSQIALWVITFLVVLSMVIGYLLATIAPPAR